MSDKQLTLYLLRHGELAEQNVLAGHTDFSLSDKGWQQLEDSASTIEGIAFCVASPLVRCADFAKQLCQQNQVPLTLDKRIKEMNFGDWDGRSFDSLWQEEALQKGDLSKEQQVNNEALTNPTLDNRHYFIGDFWQTPWQCPPPNGETMKDFSLRVDIWWQEMLEHHLQSLNDGANVLVVSHAGVIKHLIARTLDISIESSHYLSHLSIGYGSIVKVSVCIDQHGKAWPKLML